MGATTTLHDLRARAVALTLTAQCLGPEPSVLLDADYRGALRTALDEAGLDRALGELAAWESPELPDATELAGRWVRWFDLGRVAPYEGSNVVATAGGITPRLADVSGFYRSFGMAVTGDRPDHVVAELEFLALALLNEAEALEAGDDDRAAVVSGAVRSFVRDHIGTWLDAWAARVAEIPELAPWQPVAAVAARLVAEEAARRNVIPARSNAVLPANAGIAGEDEPELLCGDDDSIGI